MENTNVIVLIETVIEERDGKKCIVEKFERVKELEKHNTEIEAQKMKLEEKKYAEDIAVGEKVFSRADIAKEKLEEDKK